MTELTKDQLCTLAMEVINTRDSLDEVLLRLFPDAQITIVMRPQEGVPPHLRDYEDDMADDFYSIPQDAYFLKDQAQYAIPCMPNPRELYVITATPRALADDDHYIDINSGDLLHDTDKDIIYASLGKRLIELGQELKAARVPKL